MLYMLVDITPMLLLAGSPCPAHPRAGRRVERQRRHVAGQALQHDLARQDACAVGHSICQRVYACQILGVSLYSSQVLDRGPGSETDTGCVPASACTPNSGSCNAASNLRSRASSVHYRRRVVDLWQKSEALSEVALLNTLPCTHDHLLPGMVICGAGTAGTVQIF